MSSVRRSPVRRFALALTSLTLLAFAPGAWAAEGAQRKLTYAHAGEIAWASVAVRTAPSKTAKRIAVMSQFTPTFHRTVVLALEAKDGANGKPLWYRISVPGRPNGRTGWVPAAALQVKPVYREVVIRRGARRLELRERGKVVWTTKVAVGRPGRETPLGLFYVTHRFTPADPFLGTFAFATSAYSRMTDWPGGGIVGLHGTSMPQLLGQAVSSGCVRMSNAAANHLKARVPVGTPIRILA